MADEKDRGESKASKGAVKEAIGMITGDRKAESDGAKDKEAGLRETRSARRRKAAGGDET